MQLKFSELYHKSALTIPANKNLFNVPGVYIWGFVYHKDENGIGNPVDFKIGENDEIVPNLNPKQHVFIPYYVGKHESSILGRLKQHQDVINGNALKYTRLSNKYMRHYSFDPNFPLHSANNNVSKFINLVKHYNGNREVEYFNDSDVLNLIYGKVNIKIKGKKGHYPINEQLLLHTNNQIQDTLNDLVCSKNNFFFMYADIYTLYNYVGSNNCYIREYASSILRKFEALTVINLKGKTLGKFEGADTIIKSMSKCPPLIFDSLQNSGFDIFKNPNNLFEPTNAPKQLKNIDFPGYINELNIQH